ncbi:MAG TPA: ABC transporter ATP-binding protein, partial [Bacteroidales bacterium]|nr:ABC transporter ATP-binding protein [Bacteroidales bacterium]
ITSPDKLSIPPLKSVISNLSKHEIIIFASIGLLVIYIIKNLTLSYIYYYQSKMTNEFQVRITTDLFSSYIFAPFSYHLNKNTSELIRNINGEARSLVNNVITPLLSSILNFVLTMSILLLLIFSNWLVTLTSIFFLGLLGFFFLFKSKKRIRYYGSLAQKQRMLTVKTVQEAFGGIFDVKILGREKFFINQFKQNMEEFAESNLYYSILSRLSAPLMETGAIVLLLSIAVILIFLNYNTSELLPILSLFGVALIRLRMTLNQGIQAITTLNYNLITIDPIYNDTIELKNANYNGQMNGHKQLDFTDKLLLNGVTFKYSEKSPVILKNINLTIEKGKSVAFVGHTGCGKTTLVNIISGLLKPNRGKVTVDGVDIWSDIRSWQKNIGYIPQSIYLADNTIKHNIAFGCENEDLDEKKIDDSIRDAQLDDLIQNSSKGVDTFVGERGIKISGGQRQRIGIARALYDEPNILIMDEGTASLDSITEKSIIDALNKFKNDKTIIMIAHRLSTVKNCDLIYFIDNGEVKDSGTFSELQKRNVKFKNLAELS